MLIKMLPEKTNVGFMSLRIPALILSAVMLIASIALVATKSLNFGIDFVGGTVVEITEPVGVSVEDIRGVLGGLDLGDVQVTEAQGTGVEAQPVVVIRIGQQEGREDVTAPEAEVPEADPAGEVAEDEGFVADTAVAAQVTDALEAAFGEIEVRRAEGVGAKVSGELLRAGVTALAVSLLLMMLYITFRFEWQYGVGAVAALFHDVIITIGVFSLLQIDFNLTTIAALLTIIGYSMNDTVVVFDRVREERRRYKKLPLVKVIDIALNGTLARTLLTSGSTLLALLAIFFLGGEVLRGMSFALIWGVVIGTYSSIFVASALLVFTGLGNYAEKEAREAAQDAAMP
jgi:preprotein translocase subunit SecF